MIYDEKNRLFVSINDMTGEQKAHYLNRGAMSHRPDLTYNESIQFWHRNKMARQWLTAMWGQLQKESLRRVLFYGQSFDQKFAEVFLWITQNFLRG